MNDAEFVVALCEQRVGDAAATAIGMLERSKGGLQCLSVHQVALYVAAIRTLDQLYRSVNHVVLPESLNRSVG
jgi:hypothetical protein